MSRGRATEVDGVGVAVQHMQIGEVADRTGLSLRTIRYYEEMGLVMPSGRTPGGFRLYTQADISRLMLIKRMKPLEFSLDEVRDVLRLLDAASSSDASDTDVAGMLERLTMYREAADARVAALREQIQAADEFAKDLRREIRRRERIAGGER